MQILSPLDILLVSQFGALRVGLKRLRVLLNRPPVVRPVVDALVYGSQLSARQKCHIRERVSCRRVALPLCRVQVFDHFRHSWRGFLREVLREVLEVFVINQIPNRNAQRTEKPDQRRYLPRRRGNHKLQSGLERAAYQLHGPAYDRPERAKLLWQQQRQRPERRRQLHKKHAVLRPEKPFDQAGQSVPDCLFYGLKNILPRNTGQRLADFLAQRLRQRIPGFSRLLHILRVFPLPVVHGRGILAQQDGQEVARFLECDLRGIPKIRRKLVPFDLTQRRLDAPRRRALVKFDDEIFGEVQQPLEGRVYGISRGNPQRFFTEKCVDCRRKFCRRVAPFDLRDDVPQRQHKRLGAPRYGVPQLPPLDVADKAVQPARHAPGHAGPVDAPYYVVQPLDE